MDMTRKLMNILLPPIALIVLLLILPPYLVLKFLGLIKGFTAYSEDVAGKVVLITGASSGIGEVSPYHNRSKFISVIHDLRCAITYILIFLLFLSKLHTNMQGEELV
jgi:hypothetical protein